MHRDSFAAMMQSTGAVSLPGNGSDSLAGHWEVLFGTDRVKGSRLEFGTGLDLQGYEVLIAEKTETRTGGAER